MAVRALHVEVAEMSGAGLATLRELFPLIQRLPLAPASFSLELKGVPTAVASALRRVVTDELPGFALEAPPECLDGKVSDPLMLPEFVCHRIANIPLRPQVPAELVGGLRLGLDVSNTSAAAIPVYAGSLAPEDPERYPPKRLPALFNPTFELALLQPGRRLRLSGIRVAVGRGRDRAGFMPTRLSALRHLDIPQYSDEAIRAPGGEACDYSGYKVSTLVADPRHHVVRAVLPAVPAGEAAKEVLALLERACASIRERLRHLAPVVDRKGAGRKGASYHAVRLENGNTEGRLEAPGETHTIGVLLQRAVFDADPSAVALCAPTESGIALTVTHPDATRHLVAAIRAAEETFAAISKGLKEVEPTVGVWAAGRPGEKKAGPAQKSSSSASPPKPGPASGSSGSAGAPGPGAETGRPGAGSGAPPGPVRGSGPGAPALAPAAREP